MRVVRAPRPNLGVTAPDVAGHRRIVKSSTKQSVLADRNALSQCWVSAREAEMESGHMI